jgi:hypothetical protein
LPKLPELPNIAEIAGCTTIFAILAKSVVGFAVLPITRSPDHPITRFLRVSVVGFGPSDDRDLSLS